MLPDLKLKCSITRNTENIGKIKIIPATLFTAPKNILLIFLISLQPLHLYPSFLRLSLSCLHFEAKLFQMPVNFGFFFFLTKISLFPLCHLLILFFFFIQISKCPKLYVFSLNSCNTVGSILITHS